MELFLYAAKPPHPKEAVKWFYQSANAGYARAQYQLGLCLLHGRGVDKNKYEAVCNSISSSTVALFNDFLNNSY